MDRVTIKEIYAAPEKYSGKTITVAGWVRTIRSSNAFGFVVLNDGSYFGKQLSGYAYRRRGKLRG